jgi:hypothetical protein
MFGQRDPFIGGLRIAGKGSYNASLETGGIMSTIVDDLRAVAANPASRTKAEVVEILLAAADRIESKRIEMARMKHDCQNTRRSD